MKQSLKIIAMVACIVPYLAWADNTTQINLSGTLIEPPPCTINNGAPISVDFGDNIGVNRVDGVNYTKTIDYHITCDEDPNNSPWVMGLTVIATRANMGAAILQAYIDGSDSMDLGIKMILNGHYMTLNERVEINPNALPVLQAVPIKIEGSTLPEGHFHATATLLADYE